MAKPNILIIDDDRNTAAAIKEFLILEGFEVSLAESGEDGIEKIFREKPRLILLDLVLPGQSGFKTAQSIKQNQELASIPIIAISLCKEDIDKHAAAISGIEAYLEKPIDFQKLLFYINDILG